MNIYQRFVGPSTRTSSEQQSQLQLLVTRQLQYKQAAVDAKKRGDLETAKQMLIYSKVVTIYDLTGAF